MTSEPQAFVQEVVDGTWIVRRATLADVELMHHLINSFASKGWMLAKARSQLYQNIRDFYVAERILGCTEGDCSRETEFVGCGALHVLWGDLGEIRSLVVDERFQRHGIGRRIAQALLQDAAVLKLPRVFALTYQKGFFEHLGFAEVEKTTMPQKVWGECMDCPKFPNCDETAMVKELE